MLCDILGLHFSKNFFFQMVRGVQGIYLNLDQVNISDLNLCQHCRELVDDILFCMLAQSSLFWFLVLFRNAGASQQLRSSGLAEGHWIHMHISENQFLIRLHLLYTCIIVLCVYTRLSPNATQHSQSVDHFRKTV